MSFSPTFYWFFVRYIHIYDYCVILKNGSTYHYEMSVFKSGNSLCLKVYFIEYVYCPSNFHLLTIWIMVYPFSFSHSVFLYLKCISYRQHFFGSFAFWSTVPISNFELGYLSLIFNVIIYILEFMSSIWFFLFCSAPPPTPTPRFFICLFVCILFHFLPFFPRLLKYL